MRYAQGSALLNPPEVESQNGLLQVNLHFRSFNDVANGMVLYCFETDDNKEGPTLRVYPGDRVVITLINELPPGPPQSVTALPPYFACGGSYSDSSSVNLHFHGLLISPLCKQDDTLTTIINSGQTFVYNFTLAINHPTGMDWYHPEIFGSTGPFTYGGASGAIIVQGLVDNFPALLSGVEEKIIVIRDQPLPLATSFMISYNSIVPAMDLNVNYIPLIFPGISPFPDALQYEPPTMQVAPGAVQLWRILAATSITGFELQFLCDNVPQTFQVVAIDGRSVANSIPLSLTTMSLVAGQRLEVVVSIPHQGCTNASLFTQRENTGLVGAYDPPRPIVRLITNASLPLHPSSNPPNIMLLPNATSGPSFPQFTPNNQTVSNVLSRPSSASRVIYFHENLNLGQYYITVKGQEDLIYGILNGPAIVATTNTVEDWVIENHTEEEHVFHIHQIRFVITQINGIMVQSPQFYDTYRVPAWSGSGPFPNVMLRMDFTGPITGDFVFQCDIAQYMDGGMLSIIRVQPPAKLSSLGIGDIALIIAAVIAVMVGALLLRSYVTASAVTIADRVLTATRFSRVSPNSSISFTHASASEA